MPNASQCAVKIGTKEPNSPPGGVESETGLQFKPHPLQPFTSTNWPHIRTRPHSRFTLHDTEIKCLLYADDLVLLSPTEEGLQDSLNLLEDFCQSWALTVNLQKTRVMIVPETLQISGTSTHIHTSTQNHRDHKNITYLGLKITSDRVTLLWLWMNSKRKLKGPFYAIKRSI